MSNQTQKDDLLREHIIAEFGVESEGAEDLLNLIHIVLKTNEKEELSKELREIYEGNIDIDAFVDWVWNLYKEEEQSPPEETKSEVSEQHEKRVNDSITSSIQQLEQQPSSNIRSTENNATNQPKKSRPAIYDEYERMQKVENVRNINNQSKNSEKQKKQPPPGPPETKPSFPNASNNQQPRRPIRQEAPLPPMNGKRPHPSNEPKEEPKKSILDRIVKPGEKNKKTITTKPSVQTQNQTKPKVEIRTSKYEEIVKKVKPNPESNVHHTEAPQKQFQVKPQQPKPVKQAQPTPPQKPQQQQFQQQPSNQGMMIEENQDEGIQQQQQQQNPGHKLKIRCRNFPNCQNEACAFHHPTENCKNFPACPYGNKCLYIHPQINCKFGAFCQRPGCAYTHPRNPMQQGFGFGGPGMKPYKGHASKFPFAGNQGKGHPQTGDDNTGFDQNQGGAIDQEN